MAAVGHWYDFSVTAAAAGSGGGAAPVVHERRFMGRMETGVDTISDPAMSAGLPGFAADMAARAGLLPRGATSAAHLAAMAHPDLPERFRSFPRMEGDHKDAKWDVAALHGEL
jgi:hypothetical protein